MKHVEARPFADPETAARKLVELAAGIPTLQYDRVPIERINGPFLYDLRGTGDEFAAAIRYAIERGWLERHESGTYVRLTADGWDLLAG